LVSIGERLEAKGVGLKVLDQAIDTTTPTGRLMFNMLGAIAQFERELIRERMVVGKVQGQSTDSPSESRQGEATSRCWRRPSEIARQLSISRTSVHRILTV
jgi:DNA invertase Pin-like site-specific DNA recombinase